ncbi:class I adenylate-forming enzyme family protein [Glutamicibacter sp.]|uniref:class I adenylate-forming enzyme family protein n=1 Tax=Glutamicibacter sp. TaxID=1931995 RepID=UPI002FC9B2B0
MELWQALARWANQRPDHLALLTVESRLTYAQLASRSGALAKRLESVPGNRIAVHTSDPIEMAIAFYAIARSGKTLVVIDPAWPGNLATSMATALQCDFVLESTVPRPLPGVPRFALPPEPPEPGEYIAPATKTHCAEDLLIICTSGSSSRPKAVLRSAASWEASLSAGATILGASPDDSTLCPSPISHGLGLYAMVESLHAGGTFLASGKWDQKGVASLLARVSCTRIVSVPTILGKVLALDDPARFSSLRLVISGGESLDQETMQTLHQMAPSARCVEYFGSSEHSLIAYRERLANHPRTPYFDGQLFPGVQAHTHEATPGSGFGSLYIDSPFNAKGYDLSSDSVIARCGTAIGIGDQAKLLGSNRIVLSRRNDGMMNLNGNNIHPGEVGAALNAEGLANAVVRIDASSAPARLLAYTVSPPRNPSALLTGLQKHLPQYKIPHQIIYLRSWPETFSGKLNASALDFQDLDIERSDWLR